MGNYFKTEKPVNASDLSRFSLYNKYNPHYLAMNDFMSYFCSLI